MYIFDLSKVVGTFKPDVECPFLVSLCEYHFSSPVLSRSHRAPGSDKTSILFPQKGHFKNDKSMEI